METLIYLDSVGTFLNPLTGITYACNQDNTPDMDSGMKLNEVCNEWIAALSREDFLKVITI